jgi:A/G-specific adenine glycosylase
LSRLYDIHLPINDAKSRPVFKDILHSLIEGVDPSDFNNAVMELGAMVCRPESPKCGECPVAMDCLARRNGTIPLLPVKLKKGKHSIRHFNYLYIMDHDHFYLVKREGKDIWKNLYQLPLIESKGEIDRNMLEKEVSSMLPKGSSFILDKQSAAKHLLTHQTIMATFWQLTMDKRPEFISGDYKKVNLKNYTKYPVPVLIENFLVSL